MKVMAYDAALEGAPKGLLCDCEAGAFTNADPATQPSVAAVVDRVAAFRAASGRPAAGSSGATTLATAGASAGGPYCCMDEENVPATAWCAECAEHYCDECWGDRHKKKLAGHARAPARAGGDGCCTIHTRTPLDHLCSVHKTAVCRLCKLDGCREHAAKVTPRHEISEGLSRLHKQLQLMSNAWAAAADDTDGIVDALGAAHARAEAAVDAARRAAIDAVTAHFGGLLQSMRDARAARAAALAAQGNRFRALSTAIQRTAEVCELAVPRAPPAGTAADDAGRPAPVEELSLATVYSLVTRMEPWLKALERSTREASIPPAADAVLWAEADSAAVAEAVSSALRSTAAVHSQLPAPVAAGDVVRPHSWSDFQCTWRPARPIQAPAPPLTHWFVRWLRPSGGTYAPVRCSVLAADTCRAGCRHYNLIDEARPHAAVLAEVTPLSLEADARLPHWLATGEPGECAGSKARVAAAAAAEVASAGAGTPPAVRVVPRLLVTGLACAASRLSVRRPDGVAPTEVCAGGGTLQVVLPAAPALAPAPQAAAGGAGFAAAGDAADGAAQARVPARRRRFEAVRGAPSNE